MASNLQDIKTQQINPPNPPACAGLRQAGFAKGDALFAYLITRFHHSIIPLLHHSKLHHRITASQKNL